MCDWQHVVNHIQKYGKRHKALYLLSPIMAGFLADVAGNGQAFSVLGAMGVVTAGYYLKFLRGRLMSYDRLIKILLVILGAILYGLFKP